MFLSKTLYPLLSTSSTYVNLMSTRPEFHFQLSVQFELKEVGLPNEILVLITFGQKSPLNVQTDVSSRARGGSLHLHPYLIVCE